MRWPVELSRGVVSVLAVGLVAALVTMAGLVAWSTSTAGDEFPWRVESGRVLPDGKRISLQVDPANPPCHQLSRLETELNADGTLSASLWFRSPPDVEFCPAAACVGTSRLILPLDLPADPDMQVVPADVPSACR